MAVFVHCPQPLRLLLLLHRVLNLRQPLFTCRSARSVFLGVALPARALQRHREALLGEVLLPALLTPHNPCRDLTSAPEELVLFQFLLPLLCFFLFLSLLHPYSSPMEFLSRGNGFGVFALVPGVPLVAFRPVNFIARVPL